MSFHSETSSDDVMSEINMTPFVDVMLVLLIIFIVTLPLVHQAINIQLPEVSSQKLVDPPEPINIAVDQDGLYRLDKVVINLEQLQEKLSLESLREPKPVVLFYADKNARYEDVAKILASIQRSGLGKVGFVTQDRNKDSESRDNRMESP